VPCFVLGSAHPLSRSNYDMYLRTQLPKIGFSTAFSTGRLPERPKSGPSSDTRRPFLGWEPAIRLLCRFREIRYSDLLALVSSHSTVRRNNIRVQFERFSIQHYACHCKSKKAGHHSKRPVRRQCPCDEKQKSSNDRFDDITDHMETYRQYCPFLRRRDNRKFLSTEDGLLLADSWADKNSVTAG
jgi:hypothetical protein